MAACGARVSRARSATPLPTPGHPSNHRNAPSARPCQLEWFWGQVSGGLPTAEEIFHKFQRVFITANTVVRFEAGSKPHTERPQSASLMGPVRSGLQARRR
eukprot:3081001-Prymnesium_polylepis.1